MVGMIYLCMFIAIILSTYVYNKEDISNGIFVVDRPFDKEWCNKLYELSYCAPFKWFVDDKGVSKKTHKIKADLLQSNLLSKFNYRSFTTLKILIFCSCVIVYLFCLVLIDNGGTVAKFLFNIKEVDILGQGAQTVRDVKIYLGMILLVVALFPNIYISNKAGVYRYYQLKDIPVIQLFIILMLRSKRTLNEILFALSKINTKYKSVFSTGYRIYLRDKKEGLEYIRGNFLNTKFKESIEVLSVLDEYSKEESIKLLENIMKDIIEENKEIQRRKDLSRLVFSQTSLIIPFVSIIALGFAPVVMLGISIFQRSGGVF